MEKWDEFGENVAFKIVCDAVLQQPILSFSPNFPPIKVSASKMKLTLRFQGNKSADN